MKWMVFAFCLSFSCTGPQRPGTAGECDVRRDQPRCSPDLTRAQFCASDGRWEAVGNIPCANGCEMDNNNRPVCIPDARDGGADAE